MAQGSDQGRDDQAEDERQGNRLEDGSASIQQAEDATCADYGWHFQARAGGWVRHGRDEGRLIVAKLYHNDACVIIFVDLPCWMVDQLSDRSRFLRGSSPMFSRFCRARNFKVTTTS